MIMVMVMALMATVCVSGVPTASSKILQLKARVENSGEGAAGGAGEGPFDNLVAQGVKAINQGAASVVTQIQQGTVKLGDQIKTTAQNEATKALGMAQNWLNTRLGGGAPAAPAPVAAAPPLPPAAPAAVPCVKGPTSKLPVKLVGVADQLPGDREANEKLIAKAHDDIVKNKARIIKEKVLQDSYKAVENALDVQDRFHQFQAKVLRETTLPSDKK